MRPCAGTTAGFLDPECPNLYTVGVEFVDGGDPSAVDRPDCQYETGAELIAVIADRWGIPLDRGHVVGHREICGGKGRTGSSAARAGTSSPEVLAETE